MRRASLPDFARHPGGRSLRCTSARGVWVLCISLLVACGDSGLANPVPRDGGAVDGTCADACADAPADASADAHVDASNADTSRGGSDAPQADSTSPADGSADVNADDSASGNDAAPACTVCGADCCLDGQACILGECQTLCHFGSSCSSGCCAPALDANGQPVGPYICKSNDAQPYTCCSGVLNDCGSGYCCVTDTQLNEFCAAPCTDDSTCGAASCTMYDFSHTSCSGPTACGPS
jgi:hypothetical protein